MACLVSMDVGPTPQLDLFFFLFEESDIGAGFRERSEVGAQKHFIKEISEGSGGRGHHGLRWVLVGLF